VEQWEDEKGMENILPLKINLYMIPKKMDTQFQNPTKQRETMSRNPIESTRTN
jgi:hypothetical protein